MSDKESLKQYLNERLRYELLMMRFTAQKLMIIRDQLSWNAHLESFAIHARNLHSFLRNKGEKNEQRACNYGSFKVAKSDRMLNLLNKINPQALHLGQVQAATDADKFTRSNAIEVRDWVNANFAAFLRSLDTELQGSWDEKAATPSALIDGPHGIETNIDLDAGVISITGHGAPALYATGGTGDVPWATNMIQTIQSKNAPAVPKKDK